MIANPDTPQRVDRVPAWAGGATVLVHTLLGWVYQEVTRATTGEDGDTAGEETFLEEALARGEQDRQMHALMRAEGALQPVRAVFEARQKAQRAAEESGAPVRAGKACVLRQSAVDDLTVALMDVLTAHQLPVAQLAYLDTWLVHAGLRPPVAGGWPVGRRVVVIGLVGRPELNGQIGKCVKWVEEKGRFAVNLPDALGGQLALKPENIQSDPNLVAACEPGGTDWDAPSAPGGRGAPPPPPTVDIGDFTKESTQGVIV